MSDNDYDSLVPLVPRSERLVSLEGASAWRDQAPELIINSANNSDSGADRDISSITENPPGASEAEDSSTCQDRGDSAHLETTLGRHPSRPGSYPSQGTDELLTAIGTGIDLQDPLFEFSDIELVNNYESTLDRDLRNAIKRVPRNDGQKFIPIGDFDHIVTRDNVRKEFQSWLPNDRNLDVWVKAVWDTSSYIDHASRPKSLTSRRKIFSILVLLNRPNEIASFIREGIRDKDLPFVQNEEDEWVYHPNGAGGKACIVESLNRWRSCDADAFDNYQWLMLSPIFNMADQKVIFYELHNSVIFPIIDQETNNIPFMLHGAQGEVTRVKFHTSHYKLSGTMKDEQAEFAIKRLLSRDKAQFDSEVESLKRFSNSGDPHLIKLLATYSHEGYYHLIFPWADGNLRDFWKRNSTPVHNNELLIWIAAQCHGIANGLKKIHTNEFEKPLLSPSEVKKGRHGDIKPENILWFKDSAKSSQFGNGVLKISDFGLARWHRDISNNNTDSPFVSATYRAPETGLEKTVSQPYDIWTLGCLYLDFLTWYLCGWEGVDGFSKQRTFESSFIVKEDGFFNLTPKGSKSKYEASRKWCVVMWIDKLHATPGCSLFIHDFLDLISEYMLRIRVEKRHKCKDVVERLGALYTKCEKDMAYCSADACRQRKNKRNDSDSSQRRDSSVIEFPDEMAEHLPDLQAFSVDNNQELGSSPNHEIAREMAISSADHSPRDHLNKQNLEINISNPPIFGEAQTESPSQRSPVTHTRPIIATPLPTTTEDEREELEQEAVLEYDHTAQIQPSASNSTEAEVPIVERSPNSTRTIPESDNLLQPHDTDGIGTQSDQDRASSQNTRFENECRVNTRQRSPSSTKGRDADLRGGEAVSVDKSRSKRRKLLDWISSITCFSLKK